MSQMENISVFGELGIVLQGRRVLSGLFCDFAQPVSSFSLKGLYLGLPLLLCDNTVVFWWGRLCLAQLLPIGLEESVVHLSDLPAGVSDEIGVARDVLIKLPHLLTANLRLYAGQFLIESQVVLGETQLLLPNFVLSLHGGPSASGYSITLYCVATHSSVDVDKRIHEF